MGLRRRIQTERQRGVGTNAGSTVEFPPGDCESRRTRISFFAQLSVALLVISILSLILSRTFAPGNEMIVSLFRFSPPGKVSEGESRNQMSTSGSPERMLACMPTVSRKGGIEYVSNAVKSWRLATRRVPGLHRIVVFHMDISQEARALHLDNWLKKVFYRGNSWSSAMSSSESSDWLLLRDRRSDDLQRPTRSTHGDSQERIAWRSKEALDYAEVLERCTEMATGDYIAILQDDVLFSRSPSTLLDWLDARIGGTPGESTGRRRGLSIPWCTASLFDLRSSASLKSKLAHPPSNGLDGYEKLQSSNLVARVYDIRDGGKSVLRLASFIRRSFDSSPVDWLADSWCKKRHRKTFSIVPSLVRHRGRQSSFLSNNRAGTVT